MRKRPCSLCGKTPARQVIYGYPSPELKKSADRGEVILGGCLIGGDDPQWLCRECESSRGDPLEIPDEGA